MRYEDFGAVDGVKNKFGLDINEDVCPICSRVYAECYIKIPNKIGWDITPISCKLCLPKLKKVVNNLIFFEDLKLDE